MDEGLRDLREEFRERLIPRREFIRRATLLGLSLSGAVAFLNACRDEQGGEPGEGEPITMGALVPLSGITEILGPPMQNNAMLAVEEINQAGGIQGRRIDLLVEDTASDPDTAVEKARKLIRQDQVDVIVGVLTSAERWAVALSATIPAKMIYINPTYYEGGICDRYFFNVGALPNQQIDPFVPWLVENKGVSTFYLGGSDYAWPRGSFAAVTAAVEAAGGQVVGEEYSPLGEADFSAPLRRMSAERPDVIYPLYAGADGVTFLNQLIDLGLQQETLIASSALSELTLPALPAEATVGWVASFEYFMNIDTPENQDFVQRYRQRFGADQTMDAIGEGMYTAVNLYAQGVEQAGSLDKEAVVDGMLAVQFEDPKGAIRIDQDTQAAYLNDYIAEISSDTSLAPEERFEIAETFEAIRPEQPCLEEPPA
ncbi:MAG TPA: substrate-binding protein [Actinomycetota bacterium]|jgi:ABC-type branched-subunit amino acid transport system substrate-binding protein|nr:substrate-binding protein [Actinomycetota bacterium]